MRTIPQFFVAVAVECLHLLVLAAPFLLLGLALAGVVHVLMPARWIERWLGRPGLGGAARAGLVGIPLPVCSCGVVPLAIEMRRKGASEPASLAFLVTTPESGVDSILFTGALMGPVMAVARPIAAFGTALLGALGISLRPTPADGERAVRAAAAPSCCSSAASVDSVGGASSSCGPPKDTATMRPSWRAPWRSVGKPSLAYGFGPLLDDIAFWLLVGLGLGGLLTVVLPDDLAALGLGGGLPAMLVMLVAGVPLYLCASASTPIAAALMVKGLSPGAALVFLLAGPATNAASLVVLTRHFGRRFVATYLAGVVVGSLLAGLALDAFITRFGLTVSLPFATAADHGPGLLEIASTVVLVALLIASAWRGALASGWREAVDALRALRPATGGG
ncbi:MAG: SO_0444 family Cu/Zn efflux transporter [Acidobacteriota bacterium]